MQISPSLLLLLNISKLQAGIARKFDHRLGQGIGFNDFAILYALYTSEERKLRRIDLADRLGLTASGITKLLAPMEKIGLISRESNPHDARVSFVTLTPGGERILADTHDRAELVAEESLGGVEHDQVVTLSDLVSRIRF